MASKIKQKIEQAVIGLGLMVLTGLAIHDVDYYKTKRHVLGSLPAAHATEQAFTESGLVSLLQDDCSQETRELLALAAKKDILDVSQERYESLSSDICHEKRLALDAEIRKLTPHYRSFALPEAEWDAETARGVEIYRELKGMSHGNVMGLPYEEIYDMLDDFMVRDLRQWRDREFWQIEPGQTLPHIPFCTNYLYSYVKLVEQQGGIEDDKVYNSLLGLIGARYGSYKEAAQSDARHAATTVGARQSLGDMRRLYERVQDLRRESGAPVKDEDISE